MNTAAEKIRQVVEDSVCYMVRRLSYSTANKADIEHVARDVLQRQLDAIIEDVTQREVSWSRKKRPDKEYQNGYLACLRDFMFDYQQAKLKEARTSITNSTHE